MKKIVSLILVAILAVSALIIPVSASDKTVEPDATQKIAQAIYGTPTIDGVAEDLWNDAQKQDLDGIYACAWTLNSGICQASFKSMWDENYVYLFIDVDDDTMSNITTEQSISAGSLYQRDGVSFTFAPNYNRGTTSAPTAPSFWAILGAFGTTANFNGCPVNTFHSEDPSLVAADVNKLNEEKTGLANTNRMYAITYKTDKDGKKIGYSIEMKVNLKARYADMEMVAGNCIGFDIYTNNEGGTAASRQFGRFWNNNASYNNDAVKGTIQFLAKGVKPDPVEKDLTNGQKVATAAYGTPTIDGTVDDIWAKAEVNEFTKYDATAKKDVEASIGQFRMLWDENYVYVLAEIKDDTMAADGTWEAKKTGTALINRDAISFAVNPNFNRGNTTNNAQVPPSFWGIIGAYGSYTSPNAGASGGVTENVFIKEGDNKMYAMSYQKDNDGKLIGYTIEMKINLKARYADFKNEAGTKFGFDIYVNCNDYDATAATPSDTRNHLYGWNDKTCGDSYKNDATKGVVELLAKEPDTGDNGMTLCVAVIVCAAVAIAAVGTCLVVRRRNDF